MAEQEPQPKSTSTLREVGDSYFGCLTGLGLLSIGIALAIVIARDPEIVFRYGTLDTPEPAPTSTPVGSFSNSFSDGQAK